MKDLLEAIGIFAKYSDEDMLQCEHDELYVNLGVPVDMMLPSEVVRLRELGFEPAPGFDPEEGTWISYRFGSC